MRTSKQANYEGSFLLHIVLPKWRELTRRFREDAFLGIQRNPSMNALYSG